MPRIPEPKGPKPTSAGLVKIEFLFEGTAGVIAKAACIMHFVMVPADVTAANLATLATNAATHWHTRFAPLQGTDSKLYSVVCTALDGSGLIGTAAPNTSGTSGSLSQPPEESVVISWIAGTYWRGGKPRTYVPFLAASAIAATGSGQLTSAFCTTAKTNAISFISDMNADLYTGTTGTLSVVSYYHHYAFRVPPLTLAIQSASVLQRVGTQRRRIGKPSQYVRT